MKVLPSSHLLEWSPVSLCPVFAVGAHLQKLGGIAYCCIILAAVIT